MGMSHNQRMYDKNPRRITINKGQRYRKMRDIYPQITTIIPLPLDVFPSVEFHNQILIFNLPELKPYYHLPENYY